MKFSPRKKLTLIVTLIFTLSICSAVYAFGATPQDLQSDLYDVSAEQDEVSRKMSQTKKEIKELQSKVDGLTYQINQTTEDITDTEKKIDKKEKEMQTRETNLNERLKVMYKNGTVGFLDVLLGSNSISEFVSNVEMIQKIYRNDISVLETLEKQHKELEDIRSNLKEKKTQLAKQKEQISIEKTELDAKKKELEKKEDELKAEADRLIAEIRAMTDKNTPYVGGKFTWPCPSSSYITSSFGNRLHPIFKVWKFHTGIDIGASSGKDILAAANGKVIMARRYGGYGECIMIDHGGGIVTLYGHCSKLLVSEGEEVRRGNLIGKVGSTGNSTGPHLHFEVREDGEYVNPMGYFK